MNDLKQQHRLWGAASLAVPLLLVCLGPACQSPPPPGDAGDVPAGHSSEPLDPATIVPGPPLRIGDAFLFTLVEPEAETVAVAGTFNGWVPNAAPLTRRGDLWYALVEVPIGSHKYRFLIDGTRWQVDPDNERRTKDSLGNITSALVVRK